MSIFSFLFDNRYMLIVAASQHLLIVLTSVGAATIIGVGIAIATYARSTVSSSAVALMAIFLMIPSFALLGLLVIPFGLGFTPTAIALTLYSMLPIVRNTTVGLRGAPADIIEAGRGIGMRRLYLLTLVRLPLALPSVISGIRFSVQLALEIATIAAYVNGPGLGQVIFDGLNNFGSPNALNLAISGTVGVIILAVLLDAVLSALQHRAESWIQL